MLPAALELLALLPVLLPAPAVAARVELDLGLVDGAIVGKVTVDDSPEFFAAVLLSASPEQAHYLVNLPPLLADFVVLGIGQARGGQVRIVGPQGNHPALTIYGQAVVFDEALDASEVEKLDLRPAR